MIGNLVRIVTMAKPEVGPVRRDTVAILAHEDLHHDAIVGISGVKRLVEREA